MMAVFTIIGVSYLMIGLSLFCDFMRLRSYMYLRSSVLWLRYFPCFWHSYKSDYVIPRFIYHVLVRAHRIKLFSNKIISLNSVVQIMFVVLYFDFF